MKVAHIINSMFTGGAENLVAETVPVFKAQGLVVDVLLLNGSTAPFLNKLQATGCCITVLSTGSVYNPLLIFKIMPLLKKYDLIHVHLFPALYWVALAKLLSFSKVKLVFTEHNTTNSRLSNRFFLLFDRFVYQWYHHIICISAEIEQIIHSKIPGTKNKTVVITNGIALEKRSDTQFLLPKQLYPEADAHTKLITQVAGFRVQKDQKTVIQALALLPSSFVLLLVGDGVTRASCERVAAELGVAHRVVFLGVRNDVAKILQLSDFVVLSSHHEGLSLASIEGMASGKPFLASDVPGLHEVVLGAGLLFPVGDHHALAEHILHLNSDVAFYNQTVQRCLQRAANFDIKIMVQQEIALYKKLLA